MFSWGELFSTFMARKIMGAKHSCRSVNGGGVPSFMPFLHIANGFRPACLDPLRMSIFSLSGQIFGKTGQKLDFLWWSLVFSRENRRQQGAKSKHIFGKGLQKWGQVVAFCPS